MIAIAGAKGGCGKTVTTIGLAEAFGRKGTPAVAIDADRQLPNLHVEAGVERAPTIAALDSELSLESVAQPSPRESTVGILPAPKPDERVDFETVTKPIRRTEIQLLADCPSGAGPDVVEPLRAATGAIVVTTDTDRSLAAAETTIEMAQRLGASVLGAIVVAADETPSTVESWADVPVLGLIPEVDSPLTNEDAREAYEDVVRTLRARNATERTPPEYDDDRLATGIDAIDYRLGGGVAPGTVVAVTAEPASQSEQLLYGGTSPRGTLFLTTERSVSNVERAIESASIETGNPTIRHVGDDPIAGATTMIEKLPDGATLVIDPICVLERCERSSYVSFLDDLKSKMVESGSIAFLHCLEGRAIPANRTATKRAADAIFDVRTETLGPGSNIDHYVSIPKFRHDSGFAETIELDFAVDRSEPTVSGSGSDSDTDAGSIAEPTVDSD